MKIIILSQYFEEPDWPGLHLLGAMAEDLALSGHEVTVIAGRYIRIGRHKAPKFRRMASGYTVRRTWSGYDKSKNIFNRFLSFAAFSLSSAFALIRQGKVDIIYASSPPIFPIFPALLWARLSGAKLVLEVCDLWPESAASLGLIRNKYLISWTAALAAFLYQNCNGLVCLTHGILEWIQAKYQVKVPCLVARCAVPVATTPQTMRDRNAIRQTYGWDRPMIAIFAGTIGHAQDIGTLLDAATLLKDETQLLIVIVGSGAAQDDVINKSHELDNLLYLEPVSQEKALELIEAADIGLCTLKADPLFEGAIPTKLISYISLGLPVIAPDLREISAVMAASNGGALYHAGDAHSLADALRALVNQGMVGSKPPRLPNEFKIEYRSLLIRDFLEKML